MSRVILSNVNGSKNAEAFTAIDGKDRIPVDAILSDSSGNPAKLITDFEFLNGSSSSDPEGANRTFTLTTTDDVEIIGVWLQTQLLTPVTSYTKDDTNKQVTIIDQVFDSDVIGVMYRH